jgi:hypothetical protein
VEVAGVTVKVLVVAEVHGEEVVMTEGREMIVVLEMTEGRERIVVLEMTEGRERIGGRGMKDVVLHQGMTEMAGEEVTD